MSISGKIILAGGILGAGLFALYLYNRSQAVTSTLAQPAPLTNMEE
jgi:hypothetical protein